MSQVLATINELFQPGERFELAAIQNGQIQPSWFKHGDERVERWVESRDGVANLYVVLNPVKDELTGKRANAQDVADTRVLLIDCDPTPIGSSEDARHVAQGVEQRLCDLGAGPALVFSGRGWQVWLKHERVDQDVRRDFLRALKSEFSNARVKLDSTADPSRLARLPGTLNTKPGAGRAHLHVGFGAALKAVNMQSVAEAVRRPAKPKPAPRVPSGDVDWEYLQALSALEVLPADLDYQDWLSVGMALNASSEPWALDLWDSWSSRGEKYPGREVLERKWATFRGSGTTLGSLYEHARRHGWRWKPDGIEWCKRQGLLITAQPKSPPPKAAIGLPEYPVDVWPHAFQELITQQAQVGLTDPAIPAQYLTAALGALLGPDWKFGVGPITCRPLAWTVVVAPSAISGKTLAVGGLRAALERLASERYQRWKQAKEGWKALPRSEREGHVEPQYAAIATEDATLEALARTLSASDGEQGLFLDWDELSGWLGSMDVYRNNGASKDRPQWLSLRGGGPLRQLRASRDPVHVSKTHVCLSGAIQPEKLIGFDLNSSDGLFSRFMWAFVPRRKEFGFGDAFELGYMAEEVFRAALKLKEPNVSVTASAHEWLAGIRRRTDKVANELYHEDGMNLASTVVSRSTLYATTCLAILLGAEAVELERKGVKNKRLEVGADLCGRAGRLADYYVAHGKRAVSALLAPKPSREKEAHAHCSVVLAQLEDHVPPGGSRRELVAKWAELLGAKGPRVAGRTLRALMRLAPEGWSFGQQRTRDGRYWEVARFGGRGSTSAGCTGRTPRSNPRESVARRRV